jgi:hypothetical protein
MKPSYHRRVIRGAEGEETSMNMSGKTGIKSSDPRQVRHHIVDPAECVRGPVAIADTSVSIMFGYDEVGVVLSEPLAEGVVVVLRLQVCEVDP